MGTKRGKYFYVEPLCSTKGPSDIGTQNSFSFSVPCRAWPKPGNCTLRGGQVVCTTLNIKCNNRHQQIFNLLKSTFCPDANLFSRKCSGGGGELMLNTTLTLIQKGFETSLDTTHSKARCVAFQGISRQDKGIDGLQNSLNESNIPGETNKFK